MRHRPTWPVLSLLVLLGASALAPAAWTEPNPPLQGPARAAEPTAAQQENQRLLRRSWVCDASVHLVGTNQHYTPQTWSMATGHPDGVWGDREKSCRKYLANRILDASIWSHLNLSAAEQDKVCRDGHGDFRATYSFDRRSKDWSLTKRVPAPPCDCAIRCKSGYDLDTTSWPGHPRCLKLLCAGAATGIPDERFGPHENGIGISGGNVYHHQAVQQGPCKFQ